MKKLLNIVKHLGIILFVVTFTVISMGLMPLQMERTTLTNGKDKIVFQNMIHMGNQSFYSKVGNDMKSYNKEGYTVLNEGVEGVTEEKANELSEVTGIDLSARELLIDNTDGIVEQNLPMIGRRSDIHIDELIKDIKSSGKTAEKVEVADLSYITEATAENKSFRSSVVKMFFRFGIRLNAALNSFGFNPFVPEHINESIIDKRNDKLISDIESCGCDIYVQYGAAHFPDFYEKMYKKGWRKVGTVYYEAF